MCPTRDWRQATLIAVLIALSLAGIATADDKKAGSGVASDVDFGIKMAQRGLWKEALFRFQQADLQQPNNGKLLNNMAVAYEAVGAYDKALETYKRALQANSSDRNLKQNYSRFLEFYQAYNPEQPSEADRAAEAQSEVSQTADDQTEQPPTEEASSDESEGAQTEPEKVNGPDSTSETAQSPDPPSSPSGQ